MTVYNSTPQDDSNLDVTVTEATDLVTIDITPASFTATGTAVISVNSKTGIVIIDTDDIDEGATNKYHNDSTVNALIDTRVDQAFVNALDVDAFTLDGNSSSYFLNYDNFINTPTIPTNNNELTNGAGYITDYTVTESDVTTHEAALTITESQISDLQSYITDYTVTEADVTAHESALTITESQISDLQSYITDYTVTESDVTAHESALTITESQISDLQSYITASSTDTLTNKSGDISQWTNDAGYLTSESDSQTLSFVSPDLTISNGNTVDLSDLVDDSLRSTLSEINFYDAYSFPNSDGNVDQVLTTDGNGALTWEDGGGGGGALDDLDDVSITSPSDGDIIRYNGTANEFQNTNLGLTLTPTISFASSVSENVQVSVTITNWASYDDPNAWAQVVDSSGNVVVPASQITDNNDGTVTFTAPAAGTDYEIQVKVQDFGDLASDTATNTFDSESISGTFRYWRFGNGKDANGNADGFQGVRAAELWTGSNQSGTKYPPIMTADNAPTPYVASGKYANAGATWDPWKAFDNSYSTGFIDSFSAYADSWLQIDLGTAQTITSFKFTAGILNSFTPDTFDILGSNTGAFTGEETIVVTVRGCPNTGDHLVG